MTFIYMADPARGEQWARYFAKQAPDIKFRIWPDVGDLKEVRYLAVWKPPANITTLFPNLEVVFSVAAGIDHIDLSALPDSVPLVRMIEPGIAAGMIEYVVHSVISIHRNFLEYEASQSQALWQPLPVRAAADIRVGILGLGNLAKAVLSRLMLFGYPCAAWSRSAHDVPGVECFASSEGLAAFLERTDILICLLPLTDQTRGILDEALLSRLPRGASLVQMGRGGHLDQDALIRLLDSNQLHSAYLDVTDPEPLPADHPLWRHPRIRVTPHVASKTRPESAVNAVLENLRRHRTGEPMTGLVDRQRGY